MKVGDEVITMGAAGRFRVLSIEGDTLSIANAAGHQKFVHVANVRQVHRTAGPDSSNGSTTD